jgi:hypothetical protein
MDNSNSNNFYPNEQDKNDITTSNKRQKTNTELQQQVDPTDFLNFDYGFPLDPTVINQQDTTTSTIPDDFFMFVTDNENQQNESLASANSTTGTTSPSPPIQPVIKQQQTSPTPLKTPTTQLNVSQQQQAVQQHVKGVTNLNDPPNQAVFTIVVGGKPFRLSWESLKSDGPSNFFLEYFRKKRTKVMHIDRDPDIFELIVRHLRGYYIRSNDDIQNQSLLFDANYFGLSRLKKTLQEYLYVNVGGRVFRLPWDLFQKGNT